MRLVSLRPWLDGPEIRLHPRISVIVGLLPFERVELVSTAHSIAIGEAPVWNGILEVRGIEMSFVESAEILGPQADSAPVITTAEVADLAAEISGSTSVALNPDDDDPVSAIRDELAEIANKLSGVAGLRSGTQDRLTSANANFDAHAFDDLARVDGALKRAADLAERPDPWTGVGDPAARVERIRDMIEPIEIKFSELPEGSRADLAEAVALLRVALGTRDVPLPEAVCLGEKWMTLEEKRVDIVAQFRSLGFDQDGAMARLESARAALRAAEQAATPREVTKEETAEIERIHDLCLECQEKAGGGIRRGAARKRLEQAHAELNLLLESIGYTTWSQFRMGNGMAMVTPEALSEFGVARAELDSTEIEWAELRTMLESDPALLEIEHEMSVLHDAAVRLLGDDPGGSDSGKRNSRLTKALSGVLVDAASSSINGDDAEKSLRVALTACGASAHIGINSRRGLLALGDSWLSVLRASDPARLFLTRMHSRLEVELTALKSLGDTSRVDRLEAQRSEVTEAEDHVLKSIDAMCEAIHARIELHVLAATELSMAETHDAMVEVLETSEPHVDEVGTGSADTSAGDPKLPIVVMADGSDISLLDPLIELSGLRQIIVVGDGAALAEWAGCVGAESASVIDRDVLV